MLSFSIGEKVVYPLHGAGIIETIEEKEVLGEKHTYYVLKLLMGGMRVMIPTNNVEKTGLRSVISEKGVNKVFQILENFTSETIPNWKERQIDNLKKIKSGSIYKVAEVASSLSRRSRERELSTGERRLLDNAYQLIVSELSFAQDIPAEEVNGRLEKILKRRFPIEKEVKRAKVLTDKEIIV